MRRVYRKIAILVLVLLASFTVPLVLDGAADLIRRDPPASGHFEAAVASPVSTRPGPTAGSTDSARATPTGTSDYETVEFTRQNAQDYLARNSPFISDPSQLPPTVTIEYLTRAEVEARLNTQVVVPNDVPLCLVTLHGHFIDSTVSRPDGAGPQPGTFGFLLFDAHTGMMLMDGSLRD